MENELTNADETLNSLANDPEIRRRLALSLSPRDLSPAAGEAIALQLASLVQSPSVSRETSPLNIGVVAVPPLTLDLLFARTTFCGPDGIEVLGPEVPGSSSGERPDETIEDLIGQINSYPKGVQIQTSVQILKVFELSCRSARTFDRITN